MYLLPFPTMRCYLQLVAAFCDTFMLFAAFCFAATWCYLPPFAAAAAAAAAATAAAADENDDGD